MASKRRRKRTGKGASPPPSRPSAAPPSDDSSEIGNVRATEDRSGPEVARNRGKRANRPPARAGQAPPAPIGTAAVLSTPAAAAPVQPAPTQTPAAEPVLPVAAAAAPAETPPAPPARLDTGRRSLPRWVAPGLAALLLSLGSFGLGSLGWTHGPAPATDTAAAPAPGATVTTPLAPPVIAARIVDPDGAPAAGARVHVELERDAAIFADAVTDAEGLLVLRDGAGAPLPEGRYLVRAELDGFAAGAAVHRFPTDAPPDIALRAAATVSGQVLGLDGLPAAGAEVRIVGSGLYPALTGTTDAGGRFVLAGVPQGIYEVHARLMTEGGEVAAPPRRGLVIEPGAHAVLSFALSGGTVLAGVVIDDETGEPVPGARVRVATETLAALPRIVTTGTDGSFRIAGLEARVHRLTIEDDVHVPEIGLEARPGAVLRVRLSRAATIDGVVLDEARRPVAGAAIEVLGSMGTGPRGMPITVGATSSIALSAGVPDRLEVTDYVPPIPLVPGESTAAAASVAGAARAGRIVSSADGTFHVENVPAGLVQVVARSSGFGGGASEAFRLRAGEARTGVEIVLAESGALTGTVLDENDTPLPHVLVEVRSEVDPMTRIAVTNAEGAFAIRDVAGNVRLRVNASERPPAEVRAEVPSGGQRNVTIRMDPAGLVLAGTVVDRRGRPIESAQVRIVPLRAGGGATRTVFTDAWGRFSAEGVASPPLRVVAEHQAHAQDGGVEVTDLSEVTVTLEPSLTALGTAVDPWTGEGVAAEIVLVSDAVPPVVRNVASDETGAYQVTRLGPGLWHRRISAEGRAPFEDDLTVRANRWGELELEAVELPAAVPFEGDVVDRLGRTVAGAEIVLDEDVATLVRSDDAGHFVLRALGPGEHTVVVTHAAGTTSHALTVREAVEPPPWVAHLDGRLDDAAPAHTAVRGVPLELRGDEIVWADASLRALGILPGDRVSSVDGAAASAETLTGAGAALLVLERRGAAFTLVAPRRLWTR